MTSEFWRLIDQTRPDDPDPSGHAAALTRRLVAGGPEAVLGFAESFDRAMDALYRWDLWGAAHFAFSGCGDDGFEYLRAWMIGAGEETWALAMSDPEQAFVDLLGHSTDPDGRWDELRIHEGEGLLYAAGSAHEELTGDWLRSRYAPHPSQPVGNEWAEDSLPQLYPRLAAALPEDWWVRSDQAATGVALLVETGIAAFADGDHVAANALLAPLINDLQSWQLIPEDRVGDVAYAVGISRLLGGDVEGSADALRMASDAIESHPHLRRALAQVELASGELDLAESHLDDSEVAEAWDRVLSAKLAWRRGRTEEALARAVAELDRSAGHDDHPWDIAGRLQQIGQIFVEAGDGDLVKQALDEIEPYLAGAPDGLPLLSQVELLRASVSRMQRPDEALAILEAMSERCEGTDLAECLREMARCQAALGDRAGSARSYGSSIDAFASAGERWEAGFTASEAGL